MKYHPARFFHPASLNSNRYAQGDFSNSQLRSEIYLQPREEGHVRDLKLDVSIVEMEMVNKKSLFERQEELGRREEVENGPSSESTYYDNIWRKKEISPEENIQIKDEKSGQTWRRGPIFSERLLPETSVFSKKKFSQSSLTRTPASFPMPTQNQSFFNSNLGPQRIFPPHIHQSDHSSTLPVSTPSPQSDLIFSLQKSDYPQNHLPHPPDHSQHFQYPHQINIRIPDSQQISQNSLSTPLGSGDHSETNHFSLERKPWRRGLLKYQEQDGVKRVRQEAEEEVREILKQIPGLKKNGKWHHENPVEKRQNEQGRTQPGQLQSLPIDKSTESLCSPENQKPWNVPASTIRPEIEQNQSNDEKLKIPLQKDQPQNSKFEQILEQPLEVICNLKDDKNPNQISDEVEQQEIGNDPSIKLEGDDQISPSNNEPAHVSEMDQDQQLLQPSSFMGVPGCQGGKEEGSCRLGEYKFGSTIVEVNEETPENSDDQSQNEDEEYVVEHYETGSRYQGYKRNNMRNGKGIFYYQDGGHYDGDWKDNKMHGYGKLYYQGGRLAYEGYWNNDQFHGYGKVFNDNPEPLNLPFDYTNFDLLQDFWVYYEGSLVADTKEGRGMIQLTNGEVFQGDFHADRIQGSGKYYALDGSTIAGIWRDSQLMKFL